MTRTTDTIATTGNEQSDHDAIETVAADLVDHGFSPVDSEPGEWLLMSDPDGNEAEIRIVRDGEAADWQLVTSDQDPDNDPYLYRDATGASLPLLTEV